MLSPEDLEKLRRAGRVAANAREKGMAMVKEGVKLFDVAEEVEGYIRSQGLKLAFPCNISINEIAAHYTPSPNDKTIFEVGDIVKVDVGAQLDGFVGDTAGTVEVGSRRFTDIIDAARDARDSVMEFIGEGVSLQEVGSAVEATIKSRGFEPIRNLTGHQIKPYNLHSGFSVPNYDNGDESRFEQGMIIACEPFATNGDGYIVSGRPGNICRVIRDEPVKDPELQDFMDYVKEEFATFPFCARSCDYPKAELKIRKLLSHGYLSSYAMLVEKKKGCVAQAEHTVYIGGKRAEILTLSDDGI